MPIQVSIGLAITLAFAMLVLTTALHHHALLFLTRRTRGEPLTRTRAIALLLAIVGVHLALICLYAGAYVAGANVLALGHLHGPSGKATLDYFYFAAETYSTLGYGDIVPTGELRLIASVESLNGLLLLAWSGSFLFGVLDARDQPRREA